MGTQSAKTFRLSVVRRERLTHSLLLSLLLTLLYLLTHSVSFAIVKVLLMRYLDAEEQKRINLVRGQKRRKDEQ